MKRVISIAICAVLCGCAVSTESSDKQDSAWLYYHELGMSSFLVKNYSEAIANFYKATQIAPNNPQVWNSLGMAYTEVGEFDKAESAFLKSLQVDKNFTEAYLNMGVMYYRKGDYNRAKEHLETALKDETFVKKHMAFYYLAKVHQKLNNLQDYVRNLERAVAYNPNYVDAQIELAQFYEESKQFEKAMHIYMYLVQNQQAQPYIRLALARNAWLAGNVALAKFTINELMNDRSIDQNTFALTKELLEKILISEHEKKQNLPTKESSSQKVKPTEQGVERERKQEEVQNTPNNTAIKQEKEMQENEQEKTILVDVDYTKPQQRIFYIQLGAFSNMESAQSYKQKLEKNTEIRNLTIEKKDGIYKVLYGAFSNRSDAEKELSKIKSLGIDGIILSV